MTTARTPKYRRQKSKPVARAFVELDGSRHYLGQYGTAESKQRYHQLLAERSAGMIGTLQKVGEITVVELVARFWKHAKSYYVRPDGTPTILHRVKMALKPVKELYGTIPASTFGPNFLRTVRHGWIEAGLARKTINDYVAVVKQMFKWGASYELVPGSVHHTLLTVEGLKRGRSGVKETMPIKPVPGCTSVCQPTGMGADSASTAHRCPWWRAGDDASD